MLVGDADLLLKSNFLVLKLAEAVLEQKCLNLLLFELQLLLELARLFLASDRTVHVDGALKIADLNVSEPKEVAHIRLLSDFALRRCD